MQVQPSRLQLARRGPAPFRSTCQPLRPLTSRPHQQAQVRCKAADDPYQILGVDRDAPSADVDKAYRVKMYAFRNDSAMLRKIEAAHSSLQLSALSNRKKGKGIDKSVAYADQEPLFPWRPKRWDATPKVIMVFGAMQLGMVAYGFQQPALSKTIFCGLIGIVGNVLKQNAINPPPTDPEMATDEEAGRSSRNFVRGFLMGVFATFAGTLLFSLPEVLLQYLPGTVLPVIPGVPNIIVSAKILGSALFNWVITSFYY